MRWSAVTALVLAVLTLGLLGALPARSGWHGAAGVLFFVFLVGGALVTLLLAVRRKPRDGAALGMAIAGTVGALGVLAAGIYLAAENDVADIGGPAICLQCLLLALVCLPIALTRVG